MAPKPMTPIQRAVSHVASAIVALAVVVYLAIGALAGRLSPDGRIINPIGSGAMIGPIVTGVAVFLGLMFLFALIFRVINSVRSS
jgi:hypothetical protein